MELDGLHEALKDGFLEDSLLLFCCNVLLPSTKSLENYFLVLKRNETYVTRLLIWQSCCSLC